MKLRWTFRLAFVFTLAGVAGVLKGWQADEFRPTKVVGRFPLITEAPFLHARDVGDAISPMEIVLGIEIDGVARAYPINMLTGPQREIINDRLNGRAIAATW